MQNSELRTQNSEFQENPDKVSAECKRPERVLVCFAVKEEAQPFLKAVGSTDKPRVIVTGMGEKNTRKAFEEALAHEKPELVLTCGFAGGLRPGLRGGAVLCECDGATELRERLERAGAEPGRFAFAKTVAGTAAEKRALWEQSNADAIEMESHVIQSICKEKNIPCATVRVILDSAEENLPLNFNELMTEDQKISFARLTWALARSPGKIGALLKLQKQSRTAAGGLASVLRNFLRITADLQGPQP